jgi:hypothetical protein
MEIEFLWQILKNHWKIKFHENMSVGGELFHVDRQTDMTKHTFTICSFPNLPEKSYVALN